MFKSEYSKVNTYYIAESPQNIENSYYLIPERKLYIYSSHYSNHFDIKFVILISKLENIIFTSEYSKLSSSEKFQFTVKKKKINTRRSYALRFLLSRSIFFEFSLN